jgi:hypothetical protein
MSCKQLTASSGRRRSTVTEPRRAFVDGQLQVLPVAALQPFAASLGQIAAAIAAAFGSPEVGPVVQAAAAALWTPPGKEREAAAKKLHVLPGLNEPDSHQPGYYSGAAVHSLRSALLFGSRAKEEAKLRTELKELAWHVRDDLAGFDLWLSGKGPYILEDPDEPPDPGGLEDGEIDREVAALKLLAARPDNPAVREAAQRYGEKVAQVVAPLRAGMR